MFSTVPRVPKQNETKQNKTRQDKTKQNKNNNVSAFVLDISSFNVFHVLLFLEEKRPRTTKVFVRPVVYFFSFLLLYGEPSSPDLTSIQLIAVIIPFMHDL